MSKQKASQSGPLLDSSALRRPLPGIALTAALGVLAMLAVHLLDVPFLSPMILAVAGGLMMGNLVRLPATISPPGVTFSQKRLLRLGIMLLGLQVTTAQVQALGAATLILVVVTLASTFAFITVTGRLLRVDPGLTALIAAGTSVCGASAVIAANTVARAKDEDVAYAVACVTVLGTIAIFVFPLVGDILNLDARAYGVWSGAAVHEVAQVAAVSFQHSDEAGEIGTVTKLFRVVLLVPLIMIMAITIRTVASGAPSGSVPVPLFVLGFAALVLANSILDLPQPLLDTARTTTTLLLATALAAMGLNTRIGLLMARGLRPALLAAFGAAFIAIMAASLIGMLGI
ncbi:MAG: putative sulfate exporter family transporter [Silicimonas sp.]